MAELGEGFEDKMKPSTMDVKSISRLVQLLKEVKVKAPDGSCLSPAGEYNLRLGILKELDPQVRSFIIYPHEICPFF